MKKVLLFPLLVLGLVGFIVSCQKEPVSAPVLNVQQEEALTAFDPSSLVMHTQVDAESGSVEDRTDETCCVVSYCAPCYEPSENGIWFNSKRLKTSRFSWTLRHVATGASVTVNGSAGGSGCNNYLSKFYGNALACQYFPELSGNFQITFRVQVPSPWVLNGWDTCASATSPSFFVAAPCG